MLRLPFDCFLVDFEPFNVKQEADEEDVGDVDAQTEVSVAVSTTDGYPEPYRFVDFP